MENNEQVETILMNIIFPVTSDKVLLAQKTRKIGVGLFNGYGGKIEKDENIRQSCFRELSTESGLQADLENFEARGIVNFLIHKEGVLRKNFKCYIFTVSQFSGEVSPSDEMENPTWFPRQYIPYNQMMIDNQFWLPEILAGKIIEANVFYDETRTKLLKPVEILEIDPVQF